MTTVFAPNFLRLIFGFGVLALFSDLLEFALGLAAALASDGATDSDGAAESDELGDSDGATESVPPDCLEDSAGLVSFADSEELPQPVSPNVAARTAATEAFANHLPDIAMSAMPRSSPMLSSL
ncbi:hypothetical protein CJ193_001940 [Pseudoglutamicibacter albus]|uniref:hypothetical protein n=1 Tax=Pseudoglutamicibacter albus TaxID=98671 RepID=UPI000C785374|nr:hypothetical protein [Pseudoglutamicibacter albus]PKY80445.1 hypothetical protein CYJ35_03860 [Pseudoglutamicibacter albus]WIK84644.1 hypothetical protein CJ193_001940 [Pseudoglutamicibacter albus]